MIIYKSSILRVLVSEHYLSLLLWFAVHVLVYVAQSPAELLSSRCHGDLMVYIIE